MLSSIYEAVAATLIGFAALFGFTAPEPSPNAGASLPQAVAVFETSLAAPITTGATSMTLVANSVRGGGSLSGYNCFTIDEGTAQAEFVCGSVSGTSVTSMTRGVSPSTGTSTIAALQFAHRRGASVKITDFPVIQIIKAQLSGEETIDAPIKYSASIATTTIASDSKNLVNVELLNDTAFNGAGVVNATVSTKGVVELATQSEAAASTATGGSGPLVIPASLATSTYNSGTAVNRVVVTDGSGKIDNDFVYSSPPGTISAYATTTAPTGWLLANGSPVSRATFSELYAVIGVSYGPGDGSTTFNLPDLRGRAIVMASSTQTATSSYNRATLGSTGGEAIHTMTANEIASHTHTVAISNGAASGDVDIQPGNESAIQSKTTGATGNTVGFNVLDPYIVLNYIIKY